MVTVASTAYLDLVHQSQRELHRRMVRGTRPTPGELAGCEYRGTNAPAAARLIGLRRFIKGFEARPDGTVIGYNRHVRGGNLGTPWTPSPWQGKDQFGYYSVTPVDAGARDNRYLNALLLDYGSGLNPPRDPTAVLRDYLVRTDAGLLLGRAYVALGRVRVAIGYFVLEPLG
jgi:hypothetical protein